MTDTTAKEADERNAAPLTRTPRSRLGATASGASSANGGENTHRYEPSVSRSWISSPGRLSIKLRGVAFSPQQGGSADFLEGRRVETCPIDVEPKQLVRWLIADRQGAVPKFEVFASSVGETRDPPLRKELRIDDEVREDELAGGDRPLAPPV